MKRSLVGVLGLLAGVAHGESLPDLLATIAAAARFPSPARADVRIERTGGDGATQATAVLLARHTTIYVEQAQGLRALVRPGKVVIARGTRVVEARSGEELPGTDFLLEDLAPFTRTLLQTPQISDDGPAGVVVIGAPSGASPHALLAFTIDRARRAIVRTQYYRETLNNLARLRRDTAWTELAGRPRPGQVSVENLRNGTRTQLTLTWRDAPDAPAVLFSPAGLRRPSGLTVPTP